MSSRRPSAKGVFEFNPESVTGEAYIVISCSTIRTHETVSEANSHDVVAITENATKTNGHCSAHAPAENVRRKGRHNRARKKMGAIVPSSQVAEGARCDLLESSRCRQARNPNAKQGGKEGTRADLATATRLQADCTAETGEIPHEEAQRPILTPMS